MIVVVSDGVHDNMHPQMLAVPPRELKLDFDSWEEAEKHINIEEVAAKHRVQFLQHFIADFECTPYNLVTKLISHCQETTKTSSEWMENNPGQILPNDYSKFPGKMDHTTCVAFRVGRASWFKQDIQEPPFVEPLYSPLSVSLCTTRDTVRIYCRTIAKGKVSTRRLWFHLFTIFLVRMCGKEENLYIEGNTSVSFRNWGGRRDFVNE